MYSKSLFESINLIENILIVGAQNNESDSKIKIYIIYIYQQYIIIGICSNGSYESDKLKPQILISIPPNIETKEEVINNYLSFAFPNGVDLSYNQKSPIIYSIVLTNEKGINSYLYILLFYEKISEIDSNSSSFINPLNVQKEEPQYFPISIIFTSYYSNIDFYRKLLIEFYKIIKIDINTIISGNENCNINNNNNNSDSYKINSFQKLELLNYLHFCCELLRPPNKSVFVLNMRFNSLEYKFNSLQEMPNNDFCIELLFNALEISVIIKLFTALLFEKHIIIISNQNLPLFCIAESLKLLLFPLRWPHIYIPNLPYDQKRFLESPTPYLMGINSPLIELQSLIDEFPSNIICDVNTSSLYGNLSNLNLPTKEETRIKSKLLKLKSKYNTNYDEIDYGLFNNSFNLSRKTNSRETSNSNSVSGSGNSDGNDDIDYQLSFAQNVQNTFFELFKNNLANFKNEYISGNIFNSQKFLNSIKDMDYKFFFEKLINTLIFEDFILSLQYYDDSFSRQFNNICNLNEKKLNLYDKKNKYYIYELKTKKVLKDNPINKKEKLDFIRDYNEISDLIEKNCKKNNINTNNNDFNDIKVVRRRYHSFIQQNEIFRTTIRSSKEKEDQKYIFLKFYGKNGFINFYKNYNNNFFLYHKIIYKEIHQIFEEITSSYSSISEYKMVQINNSPNQQNKEVEEKEKEEEEKEKILDIPFNYSSQLFIIIGLYLCYNIEYEKKNQSQNSNNNKINPNNNLILTINNEISNENNNSNGEVKNEEKNLNINNELSNKTNLKTKNNIPIIKLFINAFKKNQHEFPRNIFYMILDDFSLDELKQIEKTNIKYIDKTIQYKIDNIQKITYKSMVINMDSDNDDMNDEEQQAIQMNHHKLSDDFDDIKLLSILDKNIPNNKNKNNNNLSFIRENEEIKNEEGKNIKKTKINVIDSSFTSSPNSQNNIDIKKKNSKFKISKLNFNHIPNNGNYYSPLLSNDSQSKNFEFDFNSINLFADPMALSEKICLLLYTFLCNVKIENYNVKNYDINFFKNLASSKEFDEIKNLIISLKNISIENLSQIPKNYYCFWLNMYNFLTIFSIIFKCEVISNYYEWYRFLKNSYFEIGNLAISLYEIEKYILRGKEVSKRIYTNIIDNTQFKIKQVKRIDNNLINYGISLPTISAPIIRIYYPFNFIDSLKMNEIEFFSRNINYNTQTQEIEIPEYAIWIDPNFKNNLNNYKSFLPKGIFNFLNQKMNIGLIKYDWKLTFINFKNLQSNK